MESKTNEPYLHEPNADYYTMPDSDRRMPRATVVTGVIAKPDLIRWIGKNERDTVTAAALKVYERAYRQDRTLTPGEFESRLADEVNIFFKDSKMNRARDIGVEVHEYLRAYLVGDSLPVPSATTSVMVDQATQWLHDMKVTHTKARVEKRVWSLFDWWAGTLDLFCEIDLPGLGTVEAVVDWKTGAGIYLEYKLQIAAYGAALKHMGESVGWPHGVIVRMPKPEHRSQKLDVEILRPQEMQGYYTTFLAARQIYKQREGY